MECGMELERFILIQAAQVLKQLVSLSTEQGHSYNISAGAADDSVTHHGTSTGHMGFL